MSQFYTYPNVSGGGGGGAVDSVNSQTGVVVLTATDVGAANQTLSNLTSPTAINQNLILDGNQSATQIREIDAINGDDGYPMLIKGGGAIGGGDCDDLTIQGGDASIGDGGGSGRVFIDGGTGDSGPAEVRISTLGGDTTIGGGILAGGTLTLDASTVVIHNLVDPTNPQDAATKNYVDTAGSGANTALSNLASTAVNADIIPDTDNTRNLGSFSFSGGKEWNKVITSFVYSGSGANAISMEDASGIAIVAGGGATKVSISAAAGVDMGATQIKNMADPTVGMDAANLQSVRAEIVAKVLVFASTATAGGAATEAVTVTGLLATDTILSVSQKTPGTNSLPLLGWSTQINDGITIIYSADMGAGAIVLVNVLR